MPRDSAGQYTLPAGNPVTSFTVITSSWCNPTMADIAAELTNSLDRQGRGGMVAPFRVFDGSLAQPGLGFLNEVGVGLYREGSSLAHLVVANTKVVTLMPSRARFQNNVQLDNGVILRSPGNFSWLITDDAGLLTFSPSTAIDGETWNAAASSFFNPATGAPSFPSGTMPYLPLAGGTLTGLFIVQYNSAVIKLVDTLHGGSLMMYSDSVNEMVLDCFATAAPTTKRPIWLNKYGGNVNLATSGGAGRVAVGHGTPTCVLDVLGVANEPAQTWNVDGAGITTVLKRAADGSGTAVFGTSSAHNFRLICGSVEVAFLTAAGNLGVGVTPTGFRGRSIDIQSTTGSSVIINTAVGSVSSLRFATIGATDGWDINYNFPSVGDLGFHWNGAGAGNRVTFSSTGNVGIGVAPNAALAETSLQLAANKGIVANAVAGNLSYYDAGGYGWRSPYTSTQVGWLLAPSTTELALYVSPPNLGAPNAAVSSVVAMQISPIGNVGIGGAPVVGIPLNINGPEAVCRLTNTTATTGKNWQMASSSDGNFRISLPGVLDAITIGPAFGNITLGANVSIKQGAPNTIGSGDWNWGSCPVHNYVSNGVAVSSITNAVAGEMKRLFMNGPGSIGLPVTWATGSPVWGAAGTLVSVVCVSPGGYVATTIPF